MRGQQDYRSKPGTQASHGLPPDTWSRGSQWEARAPAKDQEPCGSRQGLYVWFHEFGIEINKQYTQCHLFQGIFPLYKQCDDREQKEAHPPPMHSNLGFNTQAEKKAPIHPPPSHHLQNLIRVIFLYEIFFQFGLEQTIFWDRF